MNYYISFSYEVNMDLSKIAENLKEGETASGLREEKNILWFDELGIKDIPLVGGKNASLGEMYVNLTKLGVKVPYGFAVTAHAYNYFVEESGLKEKIKSILKDLNTSNLHNLQQRGRKVRAAIMDAHFPELLKLQIVRAYKKLEEKYGENVDVAVRSSATAEDLPDASFAGQQETYLNIHTEQQLLHSCKQCFASLFTDRAISYRVDKNFSHFDIALSIGVQKMVRSDMACSGVMFSIDTESGFEKVAFVTGAYGLGENVVQGAVNPDEYLVFKPTLEEGYRPIISKKVGEKHMKMVYDRNGNKLTKNIPVSKKDQEKYVLEDNEVLELARWAVIIEDHYSASKGHYQPMDMEWAKDGQTGELFIVQARPETVQSRKSRDVIKTYELQESGKELCQGVSVGSQIAHGTVKVINDIHEANNFKEGDVLVTDMTDPDWEPIMKKSSAIITNRGGRTCFSGDTKLLTNKGFKTFEQISKEGFEGLKIPSLHRRTMKVEWKEVQAVMKKRSKLLKVSTSQTGGIKHNMLKVTPDHKMLNIRGSKLVDTQMQDMLKNQESVLLAQKIPQLNSSTSKEKAMAYFLGGIMSNGHVYQKENHGEVTFIQKDTEAKQAFISKMHTSLTQVYGKEFKTSKKAVSTGSIRGKQVIGQANAYRCYSKEIAFQVQEDRQQLVQTLLVADTEMSYSFLAGLIDGDGCFNNGRVNIYISKQDVLEAAVVACLRVGIVPQVTKNRGIHNIQIVENLNEINKFTQRVRCKDSRKVESRFFNTKQLFNSDINSNINNRVRKNLFVGENELKKTLEILDDKTRQDVETVLNSDVRHSRVSLLEELEESDVYNITVEENHNYIVFTEKYSPVLVNNCHAAIISREMGVPAVVGTGDATHSMKNNQKVTVSCAGGEVGVVYDGLLKYKISEASVKNIPETKTKIMMNVGNPHLAFQYSFLPHEGIGLAREEFIINSGVQIHPNALLHYDSLKANPLAKEDVRKIENLTRGYADKVEYYVDKLAEGMAMIAASVYPKKVIMRLSDFKSNEYANLIGGKFFEPTEDNPMIGFRGASRYYAPEFKDAFKLECLAVRKVREVFGLKNLQLMIPFCRTIEEAKRVLAVMKEAGIQRGKDGQEIYLMCEIPSNVILADQFLDLCDGYSLGTNDLTQLTLGVDRDSELVAHVYDERNQAVKDLVAAVINKCNERGKYVGICGQAPSDYQEFAEFVVESGIQTMSLNPDTVIKTKLAIAKLEHELAKKGHKFNPGFVIKSTHVTHEKKKAKGVVTSKTASKKAVKKAPLKKTKKVVASKTTTKKAVKKAPVKKTTKKSNSKKK